MPRLLLRSVLTIVVAAGVILPATEASSESLARASDFSYAADGISAPSGLTGRAATPAPVTKPFAPNSPFNVPIKARPLIDSNSAAIVARASRTGQVYANLFEYGIPIFAADSSTARQNVTCTMSYAWGSCPLAASPRAFPRGAKANLGSDGAMVIVDTIDNTVDEYWQAYATASGWTTSWGAINSLSGSGWGGGSTGAGASRLAGVVRVAEIKAGVINHALVMQSDTVCSGWFRAPAIKTDGNSTRSDCVPEGARVQLDPAIKLDLISGLTPGERAVARALQVYGAYVIDKADTSLGISFELAPDATWTNTGSVYTQAGFAWDYYGMPHVPWSKLRVLKSWQG